MKKRTKLNYFWLLLIIIGVGLGLASFYQQARIKHNQSINKGFKQRPNFEIETKNSAERTLQVQELAKKPGVTTLGKVFPKVAGFGSKKNYLILFQNSHELRATGGYIGSFAVLTLKSGEVQEFRFHDTSNFDYQNNSKGGVKKTPQPFQKYLSINWWGLRDANWDPHFPKTAKRIISFYDGLGGKKDIDGIVALTPNVLKRALTFTGPIKIEGEGEFKSENVVDRIQYRVEKGFIEKEGERKRRKEIMKELAEKIIAKTKSWNPLSYPKLLATFREAMVKKEIQVYFQDQKLQEFFSDQGWTGELYNKNEDYLMMVDTNLGALKTDRVIERSLKYELNLSNSEKRPRAHLEINYKNKGQKKDWRTSNYKTYLRVYLPQNSSLVGTKGLGSPPEVKKTETKTIIAGWVKVPLRSERKIVLEYKLPERINQKEYALTVQKQAGVEKLPVKFQYYLPDKNLTERIELTSDLRLSF